METIKRVLCNVAEAPMVDRRLVFGIRYSVVPGMQDCAGAFTESQVVSMV